MPDQDISSQKPTHDHAKEIQQARDPAAMACCSHHNIQGERNVLLYLVGGMMVGATWIADTFLSHAIAEDVAQLPALIGAIMLGWPLFRAALQDIKLKRASASMLASLAIIAALAIQEYVTAGVLALILLLADQFVRQRAYGAEKAIQDLVGLTPDMARLVVDGQERDIPVTEIKVGDIVRVRPGENLPVDGEVVTGRSSINQASLTGEAVPQEVQPGEQVYAGTTNISGALDIRATHVGEDTTIGQVSALIRAAEQNRSPKQLLIEQTARFFVPVALAIAFVVWFLTRNVETAITVLVVACPAALLLSSPASMVAAFASAARLGILVKDTHYLEAAANIDTVVLDKTGTLTTGRFSVSRLVPAEGVEGAELLQAAADTEQHSNHPLARSILQTAESARIKPVEGGEFEEVHGRGIRAKTSAGELCAGRASWLIELFPQIKDEVKAVEAKIEGMTGVHVVRDGKYLGVVGLEDRVRPNTREVVNRLRDLGVQRIAILTGDRLSVAERAGRAVGVDTIEAECHPDEKHAYIERLVGAGRRVLMVGDGINDGPSLAAADVGVAMGLGGSDIAANSAGVALMNDELSRVPFFIELSRRTKIIIAQNITASILIALVGLSIAASGMLTIPLAALYHYVGDVFVIANSFRLFRFGEAYSEAVPAAQRAGTVPTPGAPEPAVPAAAPQTA